MITNEIASDLRHLAFALEQKRKGASERIRRGAIEIESLSKQLEERTAVLQDAEFLLRKLAINWKEAGSMKDSALRCADCARRALEDSK